MLSTPLKREAQWTESLAVGEREFVEDVGREIPNRELSTRLTRGSVLQTIRD